MSEKNQEKIGGISQELSALKTLTMMQVKEKMNRSDSESFRVRLFRIIYFILGFVAVTVICFFLLKAASIMTIFSARPMPLWLRRATVAII